MNTRHLLFAFAALLSLAPHGAAQESPTLRKIAETGVISIGFRDKSIPFSYLDKQQRPTGYSIELCYRIVDAIRTRLKAPGLEVMLRPVTSANRSAFMVNGIVDLECGSTTNTLERQKELAFSVTTFVAATSLVAKKTARIDSLQALKGSTVVSTAGTTAINALGETAQAQGLDLHIIPGRDHAEAFSLVEADRALAFVMDDVLLHGLVAAAKDPGMYAIVATDLPVQPYGIVVRKNDPEFKKLVDEAIVALFKSGEVQQIYRKWFAPLQLPMSPALKKAIAAPTDSGDPAAYR
ncbi:transporter substrate-binding domain-containing protein [Massilia sp. CCM 8733]|uniref:Transporter substrate-binding domain-containing protein n=1 Tax=Massilia mucilaginosa TaxID=2609282 RepID=A0ABX0NYX1_9BURK|nr:transporter substrate-binding domain-containing protein [Massilia mucilaginosa]